MKRNFTFLIAAFALIFSLAPSMMAWGQTYSLTPDQASTGSNATSYITTLTEFTYNSVSWKMNQWNPSTLQIKTNQSSAASEWRFYNTSAIPGKITQVVIKFSALTLSNTSNTGFMFVGGTSEVTATSGGTAGTWNSSAQTITWTPDATTNFTYFAFYQNGKVATGTNKLATSDAIVVTYTTPTATHTLTFAVNPSNAGSISAIDFSSGDVLAENGTLGVTATAETGYTFSNWSVTGTGSSVAAANNASTTFTMGTANTTLTANFTTVPTYTVTYHANVVGTADIEVPYNQGANVTVAANTFNNPGYAFTKWTTNADGTGTEYQPGDNIQNIQSNINLYAQWVVSHEVVDVLNREFTGIANGPTYDDWSDKVGTSGAVYAGQSAGDNDAIQLRSKNSNSGIVTTTSGGTVKKVTVIWESHTQNGRTLNVYGKNTAYSSATDLYGENEGTLLGTIVCGTSTELVISGSYTFIGLRSDDGAMYLSEIRITWESEVSDTPTITASPLSLNTFSYLNTSTNPSAAQQVSVSGANLTNDITVSVGANSAFEISTTENGTYTNTLTLTQNSGVVAATDIYVRMKAQQTGNPTGTLTLSSTDATSVTITLNGAVVTPMTVAQALTAIDEATDHSVNGAYVSGVVSYVESFSESYHSITYYISADGSRNNELMVYGGKGLNEANFTSMGDLLVGDQVVVCGNLIYFNNTVYEFSANNYLVSFNRPAAQEYTLTVSSLSHVNMFVFDAEDQSEPLFEGEGTAQIYNGTSVLLSVEVDEDYMLQSLIVDGADVASQLDASDAYTFYMPTRNVTITATAEHLPTVVLCDDHTILTKTGTSVTLPTRNNSGNYTFEGWCLTNYETETTTTPTIIPAGAYTPTQQNTVLYPVYSRTEGGTGTTTEWHLTAFGDVDEGVYALVTSDNYAFNGTITSGNGQVTPSTFTFNNGIATSAPSGTLELTFIPVEDNGDVVGFKMYNATTNRYLYASNATAGSLAWSALGTDYWHYEVDNNNNDCWSYSKAYTSTNNETIYARLRTFSSTIRTYSYNNGSSIQIAKKVQVISGTTYYTSLLHSYNKENITGYSTDNNPSGWYLIASPLEGQAAPLAVTNLINANGYDLYYFDQDGDEDGKEWINYKDNNFKLESGKGYLYANKDNVTLTFTGTPYNGNGQVSLTYSDANDDENMWGYNLVGNPFTVPAYITMPFYTLDGGSAYIGHEAGSGYAIQPMQGILVHINENDPTTMSFSTSLNKSSRSLTLNLTQGRGGLIDRAIVCFNDSQALPKLQFRDGSTKVYIPVDGKDYAVVSAQNQGEMPVSFKAEENGTYTLSFNAEDVEFNYLHLFDNMTGNDVDLLANPSYTFEAKKTDYRSRFKLVFATGNNSNDDTFAFYSSGNWVITNEGEATLQVVDVTGRIVSSEAINGCANININAANGVYMLRLVNGNNVKTQKIVVK